MTAEDYIVHYGILGMKWGKRKARTSDPPSKVKRRFGRDSTDEKPKRKSISDMSDTELQSLVNRIQLEKRYAQLTAKEASPGQKFVKSVLTDASKQTATKYVAKFMTQGAEALEEAMKKRLK